MCVRERQGVRVCAREEVCNGACVCERERGSARRCEGVCKCTKLQMSVRKCASV